MRAQNGTLDFGQPRCNVNDMPRFTIRDLLIATTLIAVGAGPLGFVHYYGRAMPLEYLRWAGLAVEVGIILIGVGLFLPFKRPWTGALVALIFQIAMAYFLLPTVN
jgi:hypothetical protein